MKLRDAVVLVTGASSGIGEATARAASRAGARVVLAARRGDRLRALAAELDQAVAVPCDVTQETQARTAVQQALESFGRLDVLVNNAGRGLHTSVERVPLDDLRDILELNVVAALRMMQLVIPLMRAFGGGSIVNVSSGTTLMPNPSGVAPYAATKAALNTLSQAARMELAQEGIAVSTVYPYITATEFHQAMPSGSTPRSGPRPGLPPADPPERVAEAILELIGTGAEQISLVPQFGAGRADGDREAPDAARAGH